MSYKVEEVSPSRIGIGEAPFWDNQTGTLLYVFNNVESMTGEVCRLNTDTKEIIKSQQFDSIVTTVFPIGDSSDDLLLSVGSSIVKVDFSTGEYKTVSQIDDPNKALLFNDGKCDQSGRLWIGSMNIQMGKSDAEGPQFIDKDKGSLYKLDRDRTLNKQLDGVSLSNGIGWSPDNKTMYYIDSLIYKLDAFDYNMEDGTLSGRRTVVDFDEKDGHPDGMTVDQNGHLWVALHSAWSVLELDPQNGKTLRTIKFPVSGPTCCCFGGQDYSDLYVTTSSGLLTDEEKLAQPLAGSVFKVTGLGTKGLPACKPKY